MPRCIWLLAVVKAMHTNFYCAKVGHRRNFYTAGQQLTRNFSANIFFECFNGFCFACLQAAFIVVEFQVFRKKIGIGFYITGVVCMKEYAVHANYCIVQ